MALKVGISTDQLISYEFGRARLPWGVAKSICGTFGINPLWLFDGTGRMWGAGRALDEFEDIPERNSFAHELSEILGEKPDLRYHVTSVQEHRESDDPPHGPFLTDQQWSKAIAFASGPLSGWLDRVAPDDAAAFIADLTKAGERLASKYGPQKERLGRS